jgi:hypothetical protein
MTVKPVRWLGNAALIILLVSVHHARDPAMAQTPDWRDDQAVCSQLTGRGGGLFVLYPAGFPANDAAFNGQLQDGRRYLRVNGHSMPYDARARLFFIPNGGGVNVRPGGEAVWNVRTETVETPENPAAPFARVAAGHVTLWRPGIKTRCSPNSALPQFDSLNSRHVSLYEFAQHHPIDPADNQARSPTLRDRLHMQVEPDCKSTDDTIVSGQDRWAAYGFDKIPNDPRLIKTIFRDPASSRARQSIGTGNEQRAAYTMEFTILTGQAGAVPACFGFTIPVPVQRGWFGRLEPNDDWRPYRTNVRIRRVPGSNDQRVQLFWKPR